MNFSSDARADFEGLLEVNRKICKQADGGKGIAYAANELCGIAYIFHHPLPRMVPPPSAEGGKG